MSMPRQTSPGAPATAPEWAPRQRPVVLADSGADSFSSQLYTRLEPPTSKQRAQSQSAGPLPS
jgi:hypothetical protein